MSISIDVEAIFGPNKTFGTLRYQKNTYAPCSGLFGRTNGPEKPMGNSMQNLHDFSGPSQKMLFLYLIIKIRSPVMPFSQIWPTLPILEAIFGSGYVLGQFGGSNLSF